MQSDSYTASTTSEEQLCNQQSNQSFQHGKLHIDGSTGGTAVRHAIAESSQSLQGQGSVDNRVNDETAWKKNRVEEYEKSSSGAKADEGPLFEVIRSRRTGDGSSIAILPNELLTHILAHLGPSDLAATTLVSHRFHELVTTPHAWRSAFARYFPGVDAIQQQLEQDEQAIVRSERRAFTRLTSKASWRSEYVMRTRLLRSLSRGKPLQAAATISRQQRVVSPDITYSTEMFSSINHLHVTWFSSLNKQSVKLVHGADDVGTVSASDPMNAKMDKWGRSDPQLFFQFSDRFPGDAQYGLGPGEIIGAPNVMDISQVFGMLYGEGFPGGLTYYRTADEMRGRFLMTSGASGDRQYGVPAVISSEQSVTSVWLAKSTTIPTLSDNLIGIMCGYSTGILSVYSLGASAPSTTRTTRFERGELTASWVLSPGVPIIAIAVDNEYSMKRMAQNRIWAVVLNALGEVFVLTKFPRRQRGDSDVEVVPWRTGRSVYWQIVEPSRRTAKLDPYDDVVDGSYSPRSSWNGMCLSSDQISAETVEIEAFLSKKPKHFRKACIGWDMQRKLQVDFAGDDEHHAGETVIVMERGLEDGKPAAIKRFTRVRFPESTSAPAASTPSLTSAATPSSSPSLFGDSRSPIVAQPVPLSLDNEPTSPLEPLDGNLTPRPLTEEWRASVLQLGYLKKVQLTTCCMDESTFALQTQTEDPLLNLADVSVTSSPSLGPWPIDGSADSIDVPGQRARFFAAGTNTGCILLWNIREQVSKSTEITSTIRPLRMIFTDSPQISSLALTALYLVHGGSDGLVQAWDPLASDAMPIRTLHSRFSSRARRQLAQAQASAHGVGMNMYAAGAICLDPDATVLRGVVSLGNKLRYWAYGSSAADQYKSQKRRLRRSEHGNNQNADKFLGTARTNLKSYIAHERFELEREKQQRTKDAEHLADRFGTQLLGGSEEEMLAYAAMLSQESHAIETIRRSSDATDMSESSTVASILGREDPSQSTVSDNSPTNMPATEDLLDADIAEAIRQSLSPTAGFNIPIRQAKTKSRKSTTTGSPSPSASQPEASSSKEAEMSDLDFAIQLSLAEQASQSEAS